MTTDKLIDIKINEIISQSDANRQLHPVSLSGSELTHSQVDGMQLVRDCTCSNSCGSNYSQGGKCPCSNTCGSNYSH